MLVRELGETEPDRIYGIDDLAKGNIVFVATGVTNGELLPGVLFVSGGAKTHSLIMRSKTRTLRFITAFHHFDYKPMY